MNQEYIQSFQATESTRTQDLQEICRFLEQVCEEQHTVFVYGRGKRKSRNQKYLELFRCFLERQTIYDWHTASFQGRNNYCKWKKRSFKEDISKRENMEYDEITDTYICHAKKKLRPLFLKKQKSKSGYESEVTVYECEDCTGCPYKKKCTKAKGNKRLYVSKSFLEKRQESYENILSEKGILYRMNRSIQVEGAFGVLKNDYEFQRFLLRGKTKVKLEILLLSIGYNLNKLHAKIQKNRTGRHLFPVQKSA